VKFLHSPSKPPLTTIAALADRYSVTVVPLGKRQTIATLVALSPGESDEEVPVGLVKKFKVTEEEASGEITSNH